MPFVARSYLTTEKGQRQPGDEVPEASAWEPLTLAAFLRLGRIEYIGDIEFKGTYREVHAILEAEKPRKQKPKKKAKASA